MCACIETEKQMAINEHGIQQRRSLTCPPVTPIPDLRPSLESPTTSPSGKLPFQGSYSCLVLFCV